MLIYYLNEEQWWYVAKSLIHEEAMIYKKVGKNDRNENEKSSEGIYFTKEKKNTTYYSTFWQLEGLENTCNKIIFFRLLY